MESPTEEPLLPVEEEVQVPEKKKRGRPAVPKQPSFGRSADPESVAVADLWYSQHELAKETRRKKKSEDFDKLISGRLDEYHGRLMQELQKPLSSFFDQYIEDNYEDGGSIEKEPPEIKEPNVEPSNPPPPSESSEEEEPAPKRKHTEGGGGKRLLRPSPAAFSRFF